MPLLTSRQHARAHSEPSSTAARRSPARKASDERHGEMRMDSGQELESDCRMCVGVMVVDDQAVFRRAARAVIDATAGFEQIGDAASGTDALRYADELRPDLVLMDVQMPGMDGLEAARRLTESHPRCVVVLVSLDTLEDADLAASCGAVDFVLKRELRPATLRSLWSTHSPHS